MANGSLASVFGAKVTLSAPSTGLYLVIGRDFTAASDVTLAGGTLIFAIPDSLSFLALMSASSFLELRRTPSIAHIGPVTIDTQRFNYFLSLLGLQNND